MARNHDGGGMEGEMVSPSILIGRRAVSSPVTIIDELARGRGAREKKSMKLSAKKFVDDFRAGLSDDELMTSHGLSRENFSKLLRVLAQKQLLDPSEIRGRPRPIRSREDVEPEYAEQDADDPSGFTSVEPPPIEARDASLFCPQCGAAVPRKKLICPECGHVLPGQERWEDEDSVKGLWDRVPARAKGYLYALPIGGLLFLFFYYVIFPMSAATMDKRAQDIRRELPKGRTPVEAARDVAHQASVRVIEFELERLKSEGIFSAANSAFSTFFMGDAWEALGREDKVKCLSRIRMGLMASRLPVAFDVINPAGQMVGRVTGDAIELMDSETGEMTPATAAIEE